MYKKATALVFIVLFTLFAACGTVNVGVKSTPKPDNVAATMTAIEHATLKAQKETSQAMAETPAMTTPTPLPGITTVPSVTPLPIVTDTPRPTTLPGELTYADLVVGFVQASTEDERLTKVSNSIKGTARELDVKVEFIDARNEQEQLEAIRYFIARQVDIIGITPVTKSGWEDVFQEAKDGGIPIILVDRQADVSEDLYATFIGSDFRRGGYNACLEMAKLLPAGGEIVEIQGSIGADPTALHHEGFMDCIAKENTGLAILDSQTGDSTQAIGRKVMETFLARYGEEIDGVYTHNDDMATGAIPAIELYGLKPGLDIKIVSISSTQGAFEAMAQGKLNCTIEYSSMVGPQFFEAALNLANGNAIPKWIETEGNSHCLGFTVYWDRNLWESAVSTTLIEDFEKDAADYGRLSFPFLTGNGLLLEGEVLAQIINAEELLPDGHVLHFRSREEGLKFNFPKGTHVKAFGFDFRPAEDWQLHFNTSVVPLPGERRGFIGIIFEEEFPKEFVLACTERVQGGLTVDNISYVPADTP